MPFPQTDTGYPLMPGVVDGGIAPQLVRQGGEVVPPIGALGDYVGNRYQTQLNPTMFMSVAGQASDPLTILLKGTAGCGNPTQQEFTLQVPALTSQMFDSYNLPIPGALQAGQTVRIDETTPGNPTILGVQKPSSTKLPHVTDLYAGEAIELTPYGLYVWTDPNTGKTYPALKAADPTVNKPEISVKYDHAHFFVDPETNELSLITNGTGSMQPGDGILFLPGAPPTAAPGVVMSAGGAMTSGSHMVAYSWTMPGSLDTELSPAAYCKADGSHGTAAVSTPAVPAGSTATGLKIWLAKTTDLNTFYLAATVVGTGSATTNIATADSGLGAVHILVSTIVKARPDLVTIGFNAGHELTLLGGASGDLIFAGQPPNVADSTIPAGHLSFGPWASLTPDPTHFGDSGNWRQVWDPFNGQLRQTTDASIWFTFDETKLDGTDVFNPATQGYDLITAWARKFDTSGNQFFYDLWNVWMSGGPGGYDPGTDSVGDADWDLWPPLWIGMDLSGPFAAYSVTAEIPSTLTGDLFVAKHGNTTVWKVHTDGTVTSGPFAATTGAAVDGTATSGKGVSGTASTGIPLYGNLTGAGSRIASFAAAGAEVAGIDATGGLILTAPTTATAPAAGGAGALPATPRGYYSFDLLGVGVVQIPYY